MKLSFNTPNGKHLTTGTSDAPPMRIDPFSLKFVGHSSNLEESFHEDYFFKSIKQVRLALVLGIGLYSSFGILDALLLPEHKHLTWFIRFAIVGPALLAAFALSYHRYFKRIMQPLLSVLVVVGGGGIILMIALAPPPVNYSYYAGLILAFIFGYTFVRLRFLWATLAGWVLVLLYEYTAIWLSETPWPIFINNNFFFISANLIGMLACYSIEYYARRDFYLVQLLKAEQQKVIQANNELEQRVTERTAQLEQANQELQQQMMQRQRTEQERARLQDQLKQAEKMEAIGNLASGAAHDLNNLLSSLVGYPELLLLDLPEDSPLREPILTIQNSGQKAARVVQDLLTLSRRGATVKEIVNLNTLVNEYLQSPECQGLLIRYPHVRIVTRLDGELLNVLGSAVHLTKALMNLVSNAAEANLIDGHVTIRTENRYLDQPKDGYERIDEGEYAVLSVADTGVGISSEDLKKIFEPFFTKKKMGHSGTGLGMTIVWWAVKDLDGFIDIRSIEGKGTRFDLYLPITRQPLAKTGRRLAIDDYRGDESVLVVDDIVEQRDIAAAMLSKLGYQVKTVDSGEAAVDYLKQHRVDVLVLDMIMEPGIDGCETFRRVTQLHPGQKAVIASGFSESDRVKEVQRLGAGAYVKKPYTMEKIATAIRAELDRETNSAQRSNPIQKTP